MLDFLAFLQPGLTVLAGVLAALFFWHMKDVRARGFGWLGASLLLYVANRTLPLPTPTTVLQIYGHSVLTLSSAALAIAAFLLGLAVYSGQWRNRRRTDTAALYVMLSAAFAALLFALVRPDIGLAHLVPAIAMSVAGLMQWQAYRETQDRSYLLLSLILFSHPGIWIALTLVGLKGSLIQQVLAPHYVATCIVILSGTLRRSRRELTSAIGALRELNASLESRVAQREREIREAQEQIMQAAVERSKSEAREQLLAELHEGLGSSLSLAKARVATGQVPMRELGEVLDNCLTDLHLIIDTLNEYSDSLQAALVDYRWRCERRLYGIPQHIEWCLELAQAPELDPRGRLNVLRIVQEALSNALRHAAATRIRISARHDPAEGICIDVEDDGIGMTPNARSGSGLRNMEKRARNIGGELRVEVPAGERGTRIVLRVPVAA